MEIDYIYYCKKDRTASVKNAVLTCEALGNLIEDENKVNYFGTVEEFNQIIENFDINKNFKYYKKSIKSKNLILEIIFRTFFSFNTLRTIRKKDSIIYSRDPFFLFVLSLPLIKNLINRFIIYECHDVCDYSIKFPKFMQKRALKASDYVLTVSKGVDKNLKKKFQVEKNWVGLQRNGCRTSYFDQWSGKGAKRLDKEKFNVVYCGSDKEGKGLPTLIKCIEEFDNDEIRFHFIGPKNINTNRSQNVYFHEWLSGEKLVSYLKGADLLVLPSENTYYQRNYTCPMKLFEYMGAKSMILSSDLPTSREIAEDSIMYFNPGDPIDLANKIKEIYKGAYKGNREKAYQIVDDNYTWKHKGANIISVIDSQKIDVE